MNRDRVELDLVVDRDVKAVLEFMQANIPTARLIGVVESLPKIGRLLWDQYEQEPVEAIRMKLPSASEVVDQSRSVATESFPGKDYAHGDSVVAASV